MSFPADKLFCDYIVNRIIAYIEKPKNEINMYYTTCDHCGNNYLPTCEGEEEIYLLIEMMDFFSKKILSK